MKPFLLVLAAGLAALAASAVRVARSPATPEALPVPARAQVEAAVRQFLSLSRHLEASGGDPRFAERLPAAPEVTDEILAGVRFARSQGRVETPELVRLDVLGAAPLRAGLVELTTREYWVVRAHALSGGADLGSPRAAVVAWHYVLARRGGGWAVASAGPADEGRAPGAAP